MGLSAVSPDSSLFIQGMWRTGSTYIWNKFREQPRYRAFSEPFHELLLFEKEEDLRRKLPAEISLMARHPELKDFYFAEYEFEALGGIRHFEKRFSYQTYCLGPESRDVSLQRYLFSLMEVAWRHRERPVFKFTRGLMRAGWLHARFPSYTILLLRRPMDIWNSFVSFPNPYFLVAMCMVVGQNRDHEILGEIARRHDVPFHIADTYEEDSTFYQGFVAARQKELYPVLFDLYLLTAVSAARYADAVVDMNELSTNPASLAFVSARLQVGGINLDLADCNLPVYPASVATGNDRAEYEVR